MTAPKSFDLTRVIRTRSVIPVYHNEQGTLFDDEVLFPSGRAGRYVRFVWRAPFSVAILPITRDGRVILQQSFRHALQDWSLEVPKGFGKDSLAPDAVAVAELREELGIAPGRIRELGFVMSDPGFVAHRTVLFVAHDCESAASPTPEETEAIVPVPPAEPDELRQLVSANRIVDPVTLILVLKYLSDPDL